MFRKSKYLGVLLILSLFILLLVACDTGTGKYFTVSFEANGGTPGPAKQKVQKGAKVEIPDGFDKAGFDFNGWYKDSDCSALWDFERDVVDGDITLYAKWKPSEGKSTGGGGGGGVTPAPQISVTVTPPAVTVEKGNAW